MNFLLSFFINPPCSAATQRTSSNVISENTRQIDKQKNRRQRQTNEDTFKLTEVTAKPTRDQSFQ